MIINYDSPGQLCNRIWSLLPSIAYGLEYQEKVLIINFDEYSGGFENLNKNKYIRFASRKRLRRFLLSLKNRGYIQNGSPNIFSKLFKLNLIEGWSNRLGNEEMVIKQADEIRKIFALENRITEPVDNIFASFDGRIVIGVHIRRGDYKVWREGIYYYSNEEYLSIMKGLNESLMKKGQEARFLLCSNETLDVADFEGVDCFIIPESSGLKDLYALSKCSYIIGPPSTYSQWASFYGKVPMKFIMAANKEIKLEDFSQVMALDKFENKNILDFGSSRDTIVR